MAKDTSAIVPALSAAKSLIDAKRPKEALPFVDFVMGPKERDPFGRDRFGDEDPHAGTPAPLVDSWLDSPSASAACTTFSDAREALGGQSSTTRS